MPSTYSPNLRIELPASGEQGNTWGNTTNNNLGTLVETAISGYVSLIAMTDANYTLIALNGANDQARQMFLEIPSSVTLTASREIIAPSVSKIYVVRNMSTGGQSVVVKTSGGAGITVPNGVTKTIACDGTNFSDATNGVNLLYLNTAVTGASASNQATTKLYVDTQDTALLPRDGTRAMTGELILSSAGTPSNANAAVSKTYADTKLSKAGGTMTGTLTLASAVPTGTWDAVPLGYVNGISIAGGNNGISVTGSTAAGFDVYLEPPTGGQIGGVKQGSNITIAVDGTISAAAAASGIATIQVNSSNGLAGTSINVGSTAQLTLNAGAGLTTLVKGFGGTFVNASATDVVNLISTNYVQNASYATNSGQLNGQSAAYYLAASGTAYDSSRLGGQLASYYLSTTGTAADSSKLGGLTAASYYQASNPSGYQTSAQVTTSITGYGYQTAGQVSTAISSGTANNANNLGGVSASGYVLKSGSSMTGALSISASVAGNLLDVANSGTSGTSVYGRSTGTGSTGVYGEGLSYGVYATSPSGYGLRCTASNQNAFYASVTGAGAAAGYCSNQGTGSYVELAVGSFCVQSNYNSSVPANTPPSDRRLKENDQNISNGLAIISSLRPVKFNWKSNTYRVLNGIAPSLDYGFIAQEVEEVLPEAIGEITAAPSRPDDGAQAASLEAELGTYKGMDYVKLIPFLTAAIQELNAKVEAQAIEIAALKGA